MPRSLPAGAAPSLAAIFPSRAAPGLARDAFRAALSAASVTKQAPLVKSAAGVAGVLNAAAQLLSLVGLPQIAGPNAKGSTLIDVTDTAQGVCVRLSHRGPRARLMEAVAPFVALFEAAGHKITLRDVLGSATIKGYCATFMLPARA